MKNNGDNINFLGANAPQIKVNLKQNNRNINDNQVLILPEYPQYPQYYNENQNHLIINEMKNVKYQPYLEPNTYNNNSVFTEYDYIPKYSVISSNISNLPSKDYKILYNNENFNTNKKTKIIKNPNRQNKYKNINNEKYSIRTLDRQRKTTTSSKANKRTNLIQNSKNKNQNQNLGKTNLKKGTKLNISKSEIQYPLNFSKNVPRNKSKYKEEQENNSNLNKEEDKNEDVNIKIATKNKSQSKKGEIRKYHISSPNTIHGRSNKNTMRQNKSNYGFINKRKNNEIKSPDAIDINHISTLKNQNFNSYSKNENDTINSYNSCQNFYQKKGNGLNARKKNEINMNMYNTLNNYGYLNTISNSAENNKKINAFYSEINNEDIYENKNKSKYINIIEPQSENNENKIKNVITLNNDDNFSFDINDINMNAPKHIKGKKSIEIMGNINNLNNKEIPFNNIIDINNYIQYKKKLINEFCHCLEEFIFINVKNNFDSFIFKLREYCKEKYFNSLLLKRIQNKSIKKNFYKQRSSSSYKNVLQNSPDQFYYSTILDNMNNIQNDYIGRRTVYNYGNNMSPILTEEGLRQNYRIGKSQGRYDIDNYNNNNYYMNESYYNNNYENYRKNNNERNFIDKYENNYIDNTLYVPKKFKQIKNPHLSEKRIMKQVKIINNYRNLNPNYNIINKYYKKILLPENDVNKSHDIDNDIIKAKMEKNYNMNYLRNNNLNLQDISYDNNYNINKQIENGLLIQANNIDIIAKNKNNKTIILNDNKNKVKNNPIYKKKVKITNKKTKIIKSKPIQKKNKIEISNNNKKEEKKLNSKMNQKEEKINIKNNGNKEEKIIKEQSDNKIHDNKNNNNEVLEDSLAKKDENLQKSKYNGHNEENKKEKEKEKNTINELNEFNNIDPNGMSNGNNIINDDTEESDDNITREIIVKDVSTRDKRLNVFIKYVEIPQTCKPSNTFSHPHLINLFQTDSIYIPASYPPKNIYHNNYYYGNPNEKTNKLKLHKILSSIIEEEEKSKAANSANNSIISEEENYNNGNYSHFFIQSIKYVTNFLQSIFNDKKKDIFFQFFKILKKIKNESFLKGLINQKKYQTLNKLKDDTEEENENNTSGDVILYNVNDNFNVDLNYFGSKSNDRRDISSKRNRTEKNNKVNNEDNDKKEIKSIKDIKIIIEKENIIKDKKYSSANYFYSLNKNNLEENSKRRNLSMDCDLDKSKNDNNNDEINRVLKNILENLEKNRKHNVIGKYFKEWEKKNKIKKELKINTEENNNKKEENEINVDYEKNVTISEACRGLSDVILDFKIYLVKFCLKNKSK